MKRSRLGGWGVLLSAAVVAAAVGGWMAETGARAQSKGPVRIGALGTFAHVDGIAIINAATLAVDEINAAGGIDGRPVVLFKYDDHASAAEAVRAFQRAVERDRVDAVIGTFISEVTLPLEPWAARLHRPFIVTGSASNDITKLIHDDYARYRFVFHQWLNSEFIGRAVCDFARDVLVRKLGYSRAFVMSEDAAWTMPLDDSYLRCLPAAGLKVTGHIRFSPDTTDFTPIYNKIEATHPNVIIAGWSHTGLKPTLQWHNLQVPALLAGVSAQAGDGTFWKSTNGATETVVTQTACGPGAALSPKSIPFSDAYIKRFGSAPPYDAYTTYDAVYVLKQAVQRARSTDPDPLVGALEKTDYVGTIGRVEFYGRDSQFTHGLKYGKGYFTGVMIQWQNGRQMTIWPAQTANAKPVVPAFVK